MSNINTIINWGNLIETGQIQEATSNEDYILVGSFNAGKKNSSMATRTREYMIKVSDFLETVGTLQDLASVLTVGNITNGTDISVTSGDNILLDSNEEGGSIASKIQFDADTFIRLDVSENGYLELNAPGGIAMQWDFDAGSYFAIEEGGFIENTDGNFSQTFQFPPLTQGVQFLLPADKADNQTIAMLSDIGVNTQEGYFEQGTRAGSNLFVKLGDYDDSGNATKIIIDDQRGDITIFGQVTVSLGNDITVLNGGIKWQNAAASFITTLLGSNATGNRTVEMPDADGTIALESAITEVLTFGGGASGDVATMTVTGGIITARTLVP